MVRDGVGGGSRVIGSSVRGQKNVDNDVPCQDDNKKRSLPGNKYIIAAADGLGSASLSHVGSDIATQAVVSYLEDTITEANPLSEERLLPELLRSFAHARKQLHNKADSDGVPVSDLNTTLLVAVGGPAGVGGAAVGDGGITAHRGGKTGLVVPREETEYENKTIPIQSDNWEESYRSGWVPDADATAVFSDGLDGVAWDGPASVSDELFDQIFDNVRDYSDLDELEEFLEDFLDGESLRKSSRDDKTLVVGALPASEWTDPAQVDPQDSPFVEPPETATADTGQSTDDRSAATSLQQAEYGSGGDGDGQVVVDGPLGGGGNGTRRITGVAAVGVLVVTVVLAAVLFGPFAGGGESGVTLELDSAELRGTEGLVIDGRIVDGGGSDADNLSATIRILRGQSVNGDPITSINEPIQVDNNNFTLTLGLDQLPSNPDFDYYRGTKYMLEVKPEDGEADIINIIRGELRLDVTEVNETRGFINGTVKQGGVPLYEFRHITVSYDNSEPMAQEVNYDNETGTFNFSFDEEIDVDTRSVTLAFAGTTDTVEVNPTFFDVRIDNVDGPVTEGEDIVVDYTIENTGFQSDTQVIDLAVDGTIEATNSGVQLTSGHTTSDSLTYTTKSGDSPQITVNVSSNDAFETRNINVNEPANFTVRIVSVNSSVAPGDTVVVDYTIENTGGVRYSQDIEFAVNGSINETNTGVELRSGDKFSDSFNYTTGAGDTPQITANVSSEDDFETQSVTVGTPLFDVNITDANESVTEGETLTVDVNVTNTGGVTDTQSLNLTDFNGDQQDTVDVTLGPGQFDNSITLNWTTTTGDNGTGNVTVFSDNNNDTANVTISSANEDENDTENGPIEGQLQNSFSKSADEAVRTVQSVDRFDSTPHRFRLSPREHLSAQITHAPYRYRVSHSGGVT